MLFVMRNTMKIQVIIIILFCLLFQDSFGQEMGLTKAEIIKFNILRIDTKTKVGNWGNASSTYYDKKGNSVLNVMNDSNFKFILYSEYLDTLLVKQTEVKYEDGKLVDSLINSFSYKFDSKGRIIEDKLIRASGEISINKTIYNNLGESDTTYRYIFSERGSDSTMTECCKYIYRDNKTFLYCYDSLGWNSPNLKITECSYSDTLWSFFTRECKVIGNEIKDYKSYSTKLYLKEGRQLKFEDENTNALVEHSYEKDQQGLIIRHVMHSKNPGNEQTQIDKFEYYYRH